MICFSASKSELCSSFEILIIFFFCRNIGICDYCHFDEQLQMSMLEFGLSPCHWKIHIVNFLLDIGKRQKSKVYNIQGFADHHKTMAKEIHDKLYPLLGLRVGEPRAGGAGTSK